MPLRAARSPTSGGFFEPAARPWPSRLAAALLIGSARLYRLLVSPMLGPSCRYLPTCSEYAVEAVERHGPWRGTRLALARLCRCHPWGGDGFDPVPPAAPPAGPAPASSRTDRTGACRPDDG